jgi:G:T/U-mismatch repair DNA glycosylase
MRCVLANSWTGCARSAAKCDGGDRASSYWVGVTLARVLFERRGAERVVLGLQQERYEGASVFVLPNPSGRNANFSYREMLAAFRSLQTWLDRVSS